LVHTNCYFAFFEFIGFDVVKELATGDLFHNNVHVLLCLIGFFHLHNVWVRYQLNDLDLLSEEVLLSGRQLRFHDLLGGDELLGLFVLALVNYRKLAIAKNLAS
jgi:hypothetical protein